MKTNKLLSLILCAVAIFSIPIIVFAHPGKTDEYGGHYDWETGEYHYHHGYPVHQHIDGYCPYDYDDQTDHSNHGGGYNYDYDYDYNYDYDYEEPADNYNYEEEIKDKPVRYTVIGHILNFVCSLFAGVLVGFYFRILVTCFRSVILNIFKINTDYANDTLIYCEPIIDTFFVFSLVMQYFYSFDIDTTKWFAIYRNIWLVLQLIIIMQTIISQKKTQKEEIKRKSQIQKAPQSVKIVLNRAKSGSLGGIIGSVAQIIAVEKGYETAVEIALGYGLQNIVVENEQSAKRAIEFLKQSKGGRATFLPLDTVKPSNFNEKLPRWARTADTVVTADPRFKNIISNLLGRTIFTEDINSASNLAKSLNYRYKIVTLDGQQINAGGSFTGG